MTVNGESCRAVEINGKVYHSVQEMIERIIDLEKVNEWHDLRNNPSDLPQENGKYLVSVNNENYYETDVAQFWKGEGFEDFNMFIDNYGATHLVAWKKFPVFIGD